MDTLQEQSAETLERVAAIIRDGGVAALPTETVYGLMTRWDYPAGRQRIYELKKRPAKKLLQMLVPEIDMAVRYGVVDSISLRRIAAAFWPGALTAVVPAQGEFPSIGVRIPDHPFLIDVMRRSDCALAATSANLSGEPAAIDAASAVKHLSGEPDVCVDGGVITVTNGLSSTVVSLMDPDHPVILRQGVVTLEEIQCALTP